MKYMESHKHKSLNLFITARCLKKHAKYKYVFVYYFIQCNPREVFFNKICVQK